MKTTAQQRNLTQVLLYAIDDLMINHPNDLNYHLELRMYGDKKSFKAIIRHEEYPFKEYGSTSVVEAPFNIKYESKYTSTLYHRRPSRGGVAEFSQATIDAILEELKKPNVIKQTDIIDMTDTDFDAALRPLCDWLASRPQNELIGNLNAIIDNLQEFGTDYTITLKTH